MSTQINNFLDSLAAAMAQAASLQYAGTPRAVWAHEAIEEHATPVYSVLRIYGGTETASFAGRRRARASIQIDTRGTSGPDVLHRAWQLHETLLDDLQRPRFLWEIPGKVWEAGALKDDTAGNWRAWVCNLVSMPGIVSRDDQNRHVATSNFEIEFGRAS